MPRFVFSLRRRSVRTRLMVWNICVVTLLLAVLGGIVKITVERSLESAVDSDLKKNTTPFLAQAREFLQRDQYFRSREAGNRDPNAFGGGPDGPPPGPPPDGERRRPQATLSLDEQRRESYIPRIFSPSGMAERPFDKAGAWDPMALQHALANEAVTTTILIDNEPVRVLSTPVRSRGQVIGAVQAAHPLADIRQAIASVNQTLLALIPVGLLFAGLAGAAVTSRALKPVGQIARTADQIDAQDLTQRLDVVGSDEFSYLAGTVNRMLGRLEGAFDRQRTLVCQLEALLEEQKRFTADASHELKTPLSVAKIHAGLLRHASPTEAEYRESVESIDHAVDRMNHLVQDLLLLAQTDAGQMSKKRTAIVVRDLLEQARHLHNESNGPCIDLKQVDPSLIVTGSEDELIRVFSNLIGNAFRHTLPSGEIVVRAAMRDGQIDVFITDTGEGIPPEHLPHLGERFYRVDSSRARGHGGTGLGLSICKSLIENHNGTLKFESVLGEGTTATVTLPTAPM